MPTTRGAGTRVSKSRPASTPRPGETAVVETTLVELGTRGRVVTDVTPELEAFCQGLGDGIVNVFVPHATAALAVIETDAGSEEDLEEALAQWIPLDRSYAHRHGSPGHGRDHLVPALLGVSIAIPVLAGRPAFGTWQRLVLVDTNKDNDRRQLRLSFLPG